MGPLPYQPIFLSFFAESCYLDSNGHTKTAQIASARQARQRLPPSSAPALLGDTGRSLRLSRRLGPEGVLPAKYRADRAVATPRR